MEREREREKEIVCVCLREREARPLNHLAAWLDYIPRNMYGAWAKATAKQGFPSSAKAKGKALVVI